MLSTSKEPKGQPMACTEEIYKMALEELAQEGNEKAKFALQMGARLPSPNINALKENIGRELKYANESLLRALHHNDYSWTGKTDRAINDAQGNIMNVMNLLAKG